MGSSVIVNSSIITNLLLKSLFIIKIILLNKSELYHNLACLKSHTLFESLIFKFELNLD
jgi:hypothetical protein